MALSSWPPTGYTPQRWHLQPGGGLVPGLPAASAPDRYRYDPADPTPAVGGSSLSGNSGPRDNRRLEGRPDVLAYSSGAHPRFARNPGSGEPLATATTLVAADQQVYHDPAHPSALILPVREGPPS
jgi:predicted acyl esterase